MADKLLVRMYNVNLGDFIYLRVPDTNRDVHILVDCGTLSGMGVLTDRLEKLKADLPQDEDGKWHLDLLVVTHPHLDHHKGFTPEHFDDFTIKNLWLSPAYDRHNPKAAGFFALKDATLLALTSLSGFAEGQLKIEVDGLLKMNKSEVIQHLCSGMGQGITPLFVSADSPPEDLKIFESDDIHFNVLSPMSNIDGYYMGGTGLDIQLSGEELGFSAREEIESARKSERLSGSYFESDRYSMFLEDGYKKLYMREERGKPDLPNNISAIDFSKLQSRLSSNALALAEMTGKIENNLSVVLLLEWHDKRLLFPGDAEWSSAYDGKVLPGRCNGAWNVMQLLRANDLLQPVDFLKVGHHGSENATPWKPPDPKTGKEHPINAILDSLLPKPATGAVPQAYAVASTERTTRWPSIPNAALMEEIGKRVANSRSSYVEPISAKAVADNTPQPQRTDLEHQVAGMAVPFIELYYRTQ